MILFAPSCLKTRGVLSHFAGFQHDHTTAEGWTDCLFSEQRNCYNIEYKDGQQWCFHTYSAKYQLPTRVLENNKLTLKAKKLKFLNSRRYSHNTKPLFFTGNSEYSQYYEILYSRAASWNTAGKFSVNQPYVNLLDTTTSFIAAPNEKIIQFACMYCDTSVSSFDELSSCQPCF